MAYYSQQDLESIKQSSDSAEEYVAKFKLAIAQAGIDEMIEMKWNAVMLRLEINPALEGVMQTYINKFASDLNHGF